MTVRQQAAKTGSASQTLPTQNLNTVWLQSYVCVSLSVCAVTDTNLKQRWPKSAFPSRWRAARAAAAWPSAWAPGQWTCFPFSQPGLHSSLEQTALSGRAGCLLQLLVERALDALPLSLWKTRKVSWWSGSKLNSSREALRFNSWVAHLRRAKPHLHIKPTRLWFTGTAHCRGHNQRVEISANDKKLATALLPTNQGCLFNRTCFFRIFKQPNKVRLCAFPTRLIPASSGGSSKPYTLKTNTVTGLLPTTDQQLPAEAAAKKSPMSPLQEQPSVRERELWSVSQESDVQQQKLKVQQAVASVSLSAGLWATLTARKHLALRR